jgi:hypothetical protein
MSNIQEYVLKKILENNRYRDEEINKLQKILLKFGIRKCKNCSEYDKYFVECDFCRKEFCDNCFIGNIKNYLSGVMLCNECSNFWCQWCVEKKIDCKCKI